DITGGKFKSFKVDSFGDHRIAMSFAVASSICGGIVEDTECINTSFPNFIEILSKITQVEAKD
ncbi:MAG: 3-phosphoshikimate 1-carboxyvinyltransferase, partial [Campylobacteraceae bacterium]|nr:3-phosphoshikimate 1-carboxyvinyltransferase [Campylobacteraceae bacterium]